MARPLRIEFEGAWYHVMNRGAGRKAIFRNDADRRHFLKLLQELCERFEVEIHAYCLMDNHYHLMLRTPEGNLGRAMRHLNGLYTQHHNRSARQDGALFRGRYKAILVEADAYWTHLSRYVHRNPLEAKVVRSLPAYPWSSYPAYLNKSPRPKWLHCRYILDAIGSSPVYRRFVESTESNLELDSYYASTRQGPVLGTEKYRNKIARGLRPHQEMPDSRRMIRPSFSRILGAVADFYDVSQTSLLTPTRGRGVKSPARGMAMYICQEHGGMTLEEIAGRFGLGGYASAGAGIRNVRQRLDGGGRSLSRDLNYILQDLTP
jgi:REP element-mobilizing transposase RayT